MSFSTSISDADLVTPSPSLSVASSSCNHIFFSNMSLHALEVCSMIVVRNNPVVVDNFELFSSGGLL
ncbi:putative DNA-polymerase I A, chloroplastic/mitochondrial [Sesbania bispinosa]|nr:putative DNA-polymerase I A, chloroplastic/mitochondrial [Sesbania bispinosa]